MKQAFVLMAVVLAFTVVVITTGADRTAIDKKKHQHVSEELYDDTNYLVIHCLGDYHKVDALVRPLCEESGHFGDIKLDCEMDGLTNLELQVCIFENRQAIETINMEMWIRFMVKDKHETPYESIKRFMGKIERLF